MSERFGIPDHAPQHAPDHAQQNPTPRGSWGHDAAAADAGWPAGPTPGGGSASYGGGMSIADRPKSIKAAIVLAMVLGPLGLFYVSFLNGVVALFTVVPVTRWLAFAVVSALGARIEALTAVVPIMWCITVPWAIVGVRWRNRKFDPPR